jgi:SPOR domain
MIRPIVRCLAAVGGAGLLVAAVVLMSPLIWPPDPDASLELENGQLVGDTMGYVWQIDANTGTIQVSSSLFGLRRTPVTVTAGTQITVGDKYGAFADLARNAHVRVRYESHEHVRLASSIEVLGQDAVASAVTRNAPPRLEHTPAVGYWVEVGVFADPDTADGLMARLLEQNLAVSIEPATSRDGQHRVLRVQVGPFGDEGSAITAQQNLRAIGYQAQVADARPVAPGWGPRFLHR